VQSASVTTETEGWFVDTLFTYGLTDRLSLFAGLNYQYDVEVTSETSPRDDRYNQDGLANPVLGGVFRLWNQADSVVNLDFGAIGRVKIQDQEFGKASGADSVDGNAADGRSSTELFARVGQKWNEANEWQLTGGLNHHFDGEHEQAQISGSNTKFDDASSTDFYVKAAYQYRPVNEFMMALALQGTYVGERSIEDETNLKQEMDSHLDWDLTFKAKYLITSGVVANFTLGQSRYPDYKGKFDGNNFDIEKRKNSRIGLGVDLLF